MENYTTKDLAEKYETTEVKVKRIRKAVRLKHGRGMTDSDIADEIDGISRRETVNRYLNSEIAEYYEAPYSAKEDYEIQKAFEEKFENLEDEAEDLWDQIKGSGSFDQQVKAFKELRQVNKDVADFAAQIGALDTEAEKHEVEHSGVPPVQIVTGEEDTSGEPQVTSGDDGED